STMLTGTAFGFSSGAGSEIVKQSQQGKGYNVGEILKHGGIQAALDTVAAAPGGLQRDVNAQTQIGDSFRRVSDNFKYSAMDFRNSVVGLADSLSLGNQ